MRITIAGTGYVGLSNAMLLAQHCEVVALDVIAEKVVMLNNKKSPIVDTEIEAFFEEKESQFHSYFRQGVSLQKLRLCDYCYTNGLRP